MVLRNRPNKSTEGRRVGEIEETHTATENERKETIGDEKPCPTVQEKVRTDTASHQTARPNGKGVVDRDDVGKREE